MNYIKTYKIFEDQGKDDFETLNDIFLDLKDNHPDLIMGVNWFTGDPSIIYGISSL